MSNLIRRRLALLIAALALTGCDRGYLETGDLPAIRERGALRIIVPRLPKEGRLPRSGHPIDFDRNLAARFAEANGLTPEFIWIDARNDLIPALLKGRGDLIAASLTITPERQEQIAFSQAVGFVHEQLVTRLGDTSLTQPADLAGRTLALRRSASFWQTAESLRTEHPEIEIETVSERLDTEEILYRVAQGELDITIADDNLVDQALGYMPELRVAFDVTEQRATAWGLRPDATELRAAVNSFIEDADVGTRRPERYTGDLPAIRERKVLRVITRNNAATYFIWRGELVGFEYDLARRLASSLGLRLEIVVPPTRANLLSWLRQGYGDVVAAGLTATRERELSGVAFGRPYNYVIETVVSRADETGLATPRDLAGRTVVVRRRSAYWTSAERLLAQGIAFELVAAPETQETEEIVDLVARGEYDLTIADSHILDIELTWRDDVTAAFTLGDSVAHAWAVRENDSELKRAIAEFLRAEYRGLWFNITYNKYFRTRRRIVEHVTERTTRTGAISPYDALVRQYAGRYGFDWRLIAAQMFEESRFDPDARSFVGAVGLMQIMPRTARGLGIDNPEDPEAGIRAGTEYLRNQYQLMDDAASDEDRLWFALASYNAGYGHVSDARRLAARLGHDPNRWFGEVETVMPLLARAEYHRNTRYGYCRCQEPVNYVRRIREKYGAYRGVIE